ncbi:MAG TPA: hypothetical protein VJB87_01120 [Candidatus Nanoarchaeia archaeon]|nr:hypothetical protein [Candidatus Nanoarchaeia archaeon]
MTTLLQQPINWERLSELGARRRIKTLQERNFIQALCHHPPATNEGLLQFYHEAVSSNAYRGKGLAAKLVGQGTFKQVGNKTLQAINLYLRSLGILETEHCLAALHEVRTGEERALERAEIHLRKARTSTRMVYTLGTEDMFSGTYLIFGTYLNPEDNTIRSRHACDAKDITTYRTLETITSTSL